MKASLTGMKMHLKTAHSNPKPQRQTKTRMKTQTKEDIQAEYKCDNSDCEYKSKSRTVMMQHIDAIHLIPWKLRLEQSKLNLDQHINENRSESLEQLIIDSDSPINRVEEISLDESSDECVAINGHVEERECPTPLPENVYICGECNIGFTSESDVEEHMRNVHRDIQLEEKMKRLESELRLEKGQHKDHLDMLEDTFKQVSSYKQYIEKLVVMKSDLEAQIESLKKDLDGSVLREENNELKKTIEEKEKQFQKNEAKHKEKVKELQREQMLTSENLRSTVLERENLRENDRILLNTFDMMKKYMDQIKESFGKNVSIDNSFKCENCDFHHITIEALNEHKRSHHTMLVCSKCEFTCTQKTRLDNHMAAVHLIDEHEQTEEISFCCTKCIFETNVESNLTQHIQNKHDMFACRECKVRLETRDQLKDHIIKKHTMSECKICNFKTTSEEELTQHVGALHNKMFKCKECGFEATCTKILKEHVKDKHDRQTVFTCDKCDYETIMENNLMEHKKNKHQQERSQNGFSRRNNVENKLCIYWNHGFCRHGIECRYKHEEIPACQHQENCRRFECSLYHFDKSLNSFLGRSQVRGAHQK